MQRGEVEAAIRVLGIDWCVSHTLTLVDEYLQHRAREKKIFIANCRGRSVHESTAADGSLFQCVVCSSLGHWLCSGPPYQGVCLHNNGLFTHTLYSYIPT